MIRYELKQFFNCSSLVWNNCLPWDVRFILKGLCVLFFSSYQVKKSKIKTIQWLLYQQINFFLFEFGAEIPLDVFLSDNSELGIEAVNGCELFTNIDHSC